MPLACKQATHHIMELIPAWTELLPTVTTFSNLAQLACLDWTGACFTRFSDLHSLVSGAHVECSKV